MILFHSLSLSRYTQLKSIPIGEGVAFAVFIILSGRFYMEFREIKDINHGSLNQIEFKILN